MRTISLPEFCKTHGQAEAAKVIGCTQGAVSQMLAAVRQVYFVQNENGIFEAFETKRLTKASGEQLSAHRW